jgi:hypothetical protein
MERCLIDSPVTNWNKVVEWCWKDLKGKSLKACLCKLVWGVWYTIYGVREMPEFMEGIF